MYKVSEITEKEKMVLTNYWKLFWFDSKQYREEVKQYGVNTWQCLYSDAKMQAPMTSTSLDVWWEESDIDGDIMDIIPQSIQYEDAINSLLYGYESDNGNIIGANKHLANLDTPINMYYLTRDIVKTNLRKNQKPGNTWVIDNPFLSDFQKKSMLNPLDIIENKRIENNDTIAEIQKKFEKNKEEYKKHNYNSRYKKKVDHSIAQLSQYVTIA